MTIVKKATLTATLSVAGAEQEIPLEVSYVVHPASRPTFVQGRPADDGNAPYIEILNVRAPMLCMPEQDKVSIMWALADDTITSIEQEILP